MLWDRDIILNAADGEVDANSLIEFIIKGNAKTMPITPDAPGSPVLSRFGYPWNPNVWYGFENY
jgi:hypothetical protein